MIYPDDWWSGADGTGRVEGLARKGLNYLIILRACSIWNHRNRCVFDRISPGLPKVLSTIDDDLLQWPFAGVRGVSYLLALAPLLLGVPPPISS